MSKSITASGVICEILHYQRSNVQIDIGVNRHLFNVFWTTNITTKVPIKILKKTSNFVTAHNHASYGKV